MEKKNFDFEAFKKQATSRLKNGETLLGKDGVLTPLLKEFLEGALEGELETHIEGRVISRAVYCIIGLNQEGYKELLGMYIGENEGTKFWLQVLTDLQNRGLEDIFIACIDNLQGFAEAIESVFPQTEVQLCIVHQVRNSQKYLSYKDLKPFMKDLQGVYKATTKELAERNLDQLESNWGQRYPKVIEPWRKNWPRRSNYFQYNKDVRKSCILPISLKGSTDSYGP